MPAPDPLEPLLRRRHRTLVTLSRLRLLFGLPLSLLGPAVVATMFWLATCFLASYHPWLWFFLAATLVMLPLLFRLEMRTAGGYLNDHLADAADADGNELMSRATLADIVSVSVVGDTTRNTLPLVVDLFLIGPRMTLRGRRDLR